MLPPDTHTYVIISGCRKLYFFGTFFSRIKWSIPYKLISDICTGSPLYYRNQFLFKDSRFYFDKSRKYVCIINLHYIKETGARNFFLFIALFAAKKSKLTRISWLQIFCKDKWPKKITEICCVFIAPVCSKKSSTITNRISWLSFQYMGTSEAVTGGAWKFRKIHRKTPVPESLFHKVAGVRPFLWILRNFQERLFYRTPLHGCFWNIKLENFNTSLYYTIKRRYTEATVGRCSSK